MAAFELSFIIRILKKKWVERLPLIWLEYVMHKYESLQAGRLPQEYLSFLQYLLNFIIIKYLEKKVDGDFSICVDERKPCGLSLTRNINIYKCHMIKR